MQFQRDPVVTDDVLLHSAYIHTGCVILFIFVVFEKKKKRKTDLAAKMHTKHESMFCNKKYLLYALGTRMKKYVNKSFSIIRRCYVMFRFIRNCKNSQPGKN